MQNGKQFLIEFFREVLLIEYEDSLKITQTRDLINRIWSTITIRDFDENDIDGLYDFFEEIRLWEGTINIFKETGMGYEFW